MALNMCHQSQKGFQSILVGITQNQKGCLVYVPIAQEMVYSHDFLFAKTFSSAIAYTPRPYSESLATRRAVLYIPYATSSHEQTGNIITFSQFEEGCFLGNGHTLVKEE